MNPVCKMPLFRSLLSLEHLSINACLNYRQFIKWKQQTQALSYGICLRVYFFLYPSWLLFQFNLNI